MTCSHVNEMREKNKNSQLSLPAPSIPSAMISMLGSKHFRHKVRHNGIYKDVTKRDCVEHLLRRLILDNLRTPALTLSVV